MRPDIRPVPVTLVAPGVAPGTKGKVTERTFLGNLTEYVVAVEGGPSLRAQSHPRDRYAEGEAVGVVIDAAQCTVFAG